MRLSFQRLIIKKLSLFIVAFTILIVWSCKTNASNEPPLDTYKEFVRVLKKAKNFDEIAPYLTEKCINDLKMSSSAEALHDAKQFENLLTTIDYSEHRINNTKAEYIRRVKMEGKEGELCYLIVLVKEKTGWKFESRQRVEKQPDGTYARPKDFPLRWDAEAIKKLQSSWEMSQGSVAGKPHFGLACSVHLGKRKYKVNEPVDLEIRFKNTGKEEIELPAERWAIEKFEADMTYGYTSRIGTGRWSDIAPFKSGRKIVHKLKPGEEVKIDLPLPMTINKPTSSAIISAQLAIGSMRIGGNPNVPEGYSGWTGRIESNEIEIKIVE